MENHFDSFTYPQSGFSLMEDYRVCLSKIGIIKVKLHRPVQGTLKTATLKREGEHWYLVLVCEVEQEVISRTSGEAVGIDPGLLHFATLSDGSTMEKPRYLRNAAQQVVSRKTRGSKHRKKAGGLVDKVHRKVSNQRKDFLHKVSRCLVTTYATIVFEKLAPSNLSRRPKSKKDEKTGASAKAGLNKSIHDAGWRQFVQHYQNKAEGAGSRVLLVDPKYTSQICRWLRGDPEEKSGRAVAFLLAWL